jgi:DivIVA domain-containing protein
MHKDGLHTGDYIRSVKFDYAMRGYKVADVEMFLSEVASDVDKLIAQNRALGERLTAIMKEQENNVAAPVTAASNVKAVDNSDNIENVQSILVSAQRFCDQIINEANEKAAAILFEANTKAKEIDEKVATVLAVFEKDIAERKANADSELEKCLLTLQLSLRALLPPHMIALLVNSFFLINLKLRFPNSKSNCLIIIKNNLKFFKEFRIPCLMTRSMPQRLWNLNFSPSRISVHFYQI